MVKLLPRKTMSSLHSDREKPGRFQSSSHTHTHTHALCLENIVATV